MKKLRRTGWILIGIALILYGITLLLGEKFTMLTFNLFPTFLFYDKSFSGVMMMCIVFCFLFSGILCHIIRYCLLHEHEEYEKHKEKETQTPEA